MDKTDGGWESTGWTGSSERLRHLMSHRLQGRDKEIRTRDSVHVRRPRPEDMNSTRCSPKAWHPECRCPEPEEDRHTLSTILFNLGAQHIGEGDFFFLSLLSQIPVLRNTFRCA